MKYFLVKAKCGHVGRRKYYEIDFPIEAESKKEAAQIVLTKPKVKKQLYNAISLVKEISYEEYAKKLVEHKNDVYIRAHTKKEIIEYIKDAKRLEPKIKKKKKSFNTREERVNYRLKKYKIYDDNKID